MARTASKLKPRYEGQQALLSFKTYEEKELRKILSKSNSLNPYHSYIGNDEAVEDAFDIAYKSMSDKYHNYGAKVAITGPASTGKTTWAQCLSNLLRLPYMELNGANLKRKTATSAFWQSLLGTLERPIVPTMPPTPLTQINQGHTPCEFYVPPMIVFIDEAHEIGDEFCAKLLTATESSHRMTIDDTHTIFTNRILWVLATTEWGDIFAPLRTRFTQIKLVAYNTDEVAQMVKLKYPSYSDSICRQIAIYSSRIPRQALKFAEAVSLAQSRTKQTPLQACHNVAKRKGIDQFGLTKQMRDVLLALYGAKENGLSKEHLCYIAGCEEKEFKADVRSPLSTHTEERPALVQISNRHYLTDEGVKFVVKNVIKQVKSGAYVPSSKIHETEKISPEALKVFDGVVYE